MATIYVENVPYTVGDGQNLLQACLSLGFNLPYFCWHPALGSVGACRQCAVKQFKDEKDTKGKIVMACMVPARDGARISIDDDDVRRFRAAVIEWLMTNHPHDCPVCDEGSECHLQDMTVMTGHDYREYRFRKRTYRNQDLGPLVTHEMNRCIQCYRCVRYYRDYAGGRDLDVFGAHDHVYFGRDRDGTLQSEFSGNLVEVCPTGVFTDKTLKRHYTRKWDLQTAPSLCVLCGVGCNTIPGERYGQLRRIRNRYHSQVNTYFLCDRGRYGYEFVNAPQRIRQGLYRLPVGRPDSERPDGILPATRPLVMQELGAILSSSQGVVGIGSPSASLEDNFALRTFVGPDRFCDGMSQGESHLVNLALRILREGPAGAASLADVEKADAVLILGEDVSNTAPRVALALRQSSRQQPMKLAKTLKVAPWDDLAVREAVQQAKGPFFIAAPADTRLDDLATHTYRGAPDDLARLGFAVAHALNEESPAVADLPAETQALARTIAKALREADRPLIVCGPSLGSESLLHSAANVAWALCLAGKTAGLLLAMPECNSLGAAMMGGQSISAAFEAVRDGSADTVIILENDLYRRAETADVQAMIDQARHVILIGSMAGAMAERADISLPGATWAESDGTLVSYEGRAQRFFQVFVPEGDIQESWRWLRDVMRTAGREEVEAWQGLDDILAAMAAAIPAFAEVPGIAPPAGFRINGQKIPRQPFRWSGRTAIWADIDVNEPKVVPDPDTPLAFTMEGYDGQPPASLIPRFWAPGWNSPQAVTRFQEEVNGPLRGGDPGRRLIEPAKGAKVSYLGRAPEAFAPRQGQWLALPMYYIFGSEPLSMLSPGIAARAPKPHVGLGVEDAKALNLNEGDPVELTIGGTLRRLPVMFRPDLPKGVIALPAGLPGLTGIALPAWATLQRGGTR